VTGLGQATTRLLVDPVLALVFPSSCPGCGRDAEGEDNECVAGRHRHDGRDDEQRHRKLHREKRAQRQRPLIC